MKKLIAVAVLLVSAIFADDFSDGFRIGVVDKLSKKGIICKTWEGQMLQDGQAAYGKSRLFKFSTNDENLAKKISDSAGLRVRLKYTQKKFFSTKCSGDTQYFVTDVQVLK